MKKLLAMLLVTVLCLSMPDATFGQYFGKNKVQYSKFNWLYNTASSTGRTYRPSILTSISPRAEIRLPPLSGRWRRSVTSRCAALSAMSCRIASR